MPTTIPAEIIRLLGLSYGQIAAASHHTISKSTVFRIATGQLNPTPKLRQAFTEAIARCIQARLANMDSAFLFPATAPAPAIESTEPTPIAEEPLKLTA